MRTELQEVNEPLIGTASWMPPAVVEDRYAYRNGAIWLGRNGDERRAPIGRKDDSHVLLCAKTRSGKGRALITNNLLLWPGSLFVNDPKGENASVTAARRGNGSAHVKESFGQKVCVLDSHGTATVDDAYRGYYNPVAELAPNDPNTPSKAALIADSCVSMHQKSDATWDMKARTLIKALILHIATDPHIPDTARDLVTLRRFIVAGDVFAVEYIKANVDPEKLRANPPDGTLMLLQAMAENQAFGGMIADQARSYLESHKSQPKMWNSIRTSAEEHTDWIDDPLMRDVLRAGKFPQAFKAADLQTDPNGVSVYVCLPSSQKDVFASWPRILVNMILAAAQEHGNHHPATGHQTLMMLDEFATMERMKKIETAAADIAGAGVKMFFVVQSLTQLKGIYGENWESFASAADTHIYYGFNDNFTAEYVSKRLGEVEITRTTRSGSTAINESEATAEMSGGSKSVADNRSQTRTSGTSDSFGGGYGSSSGRSSGSSSGTSWGPGLLSLFASGHQYGSQSGHNSGRSSHRNYQNSRSQSAADTAGRTETHTDQWSNTATHTSGRTETDGWTEGLHRKPLATINELMTIFGTIDDERDPAYPGIGLISTASQPPMLIHKSHYDQDRFFQNLFNPHPKHGLALKNIDSNKINERLYSKSHKFDLPAETMLFAPNSESNSFFNKGEKIGLICNYHENYQTETPVYAPHDCYVLYRGKLEITEITKPSIGYFSSFDIISSSHDIYSFKDAINRINTELHPLSMVLFERKKHYQMAEAGTHVALSMVLGAPLAGGALGLYIEDSIISAIIYGIITSIIAACIAYIFFKSIGGSFSDPLQGIKLKLQSASRPINSLREELKDAMLHQT